MRPDYENMVNVYIYILHWSVILFSVGVHRLFMI